MSVNSDLHEEARRRLGRVPPGWTGNVRADAVGGFLAAIVSLPLSVGFGILAFAPLGERYLSSGIVAGLYGAIFLGLVAIVCGARTVAIYAPRSLVAFMIASVALHSIAESDSPLLAGADPVVLVSALLLTLSLAGLLQLVFGAIGFGSLMKFIPSPVMAGFQNAAAILILYSQVHVMLGLPTRVGPANLAAALPAAKPLNLVLGVLTVLVIWHGTKISRRLPPAVLGLIFGMLAYYLLVWLGFGAALGPVIGPMPFLLPDGTQLGQIIALTAMPGFTDLLPSLLAAALSVAVVASLDVLICAKIVETLSGQRTEGNAELRRIGLANLLTPLMGGLAGAISIGASGANFRGGARSSLSVLVHSLVILLIVVLLPPLFARLPIVVVGAILTVIAIQLFDAWTLQLASKVVGRQAVDWRRVALDLAVIVAVTAIAVIGDIVSAVLLGVGVAVAFFVLRMSRSIIRREYRCGAIHSRRTRGEQDSAILAEHGDGIVVIELEGPLFFGSAETLAARVDAARVEGGRYMILDFRRVNEVDSTAARLIVQAQDRMKSRGQTLLLAGADTNRRAAAALRDAGVFAALTRERVFPDVDHAIEWAEDDLIAVTVGKARSGGEYPFERMDLTRGFGASELAGFREVLDRRTYAEGDVLVREGDEGNELFILASGSASVNMRLPGHAHAERLVTFSPGTAFGEFALLDRETRSATITADEEVVCYVLARERFEELTRTRHAIAVKLLTNLGRELSLRLRRANRMIAQLGE